jgi:hypothetical protein
MSDPLVLHYVQEANNRGGGYIMALNMMAEDLRRAWDGYPPLRAPEQSVPETATFTVNISPRKRPDWWDQPIDPDE